MSAKDIGKGELYQEFIEWFLKFRIINFPYKTFMRYKLTYESWRELFYTLTIKRKNMWDRYFTKCKTLRWFWFVLQRNIF